MTNSSTAKGLLHKIFPILSLGAVIIFIFQIITTSLIKKQFASVDLRNRIVGSRVLEHKKDVSPYYYKWVKEDGDKYLDLYDTPYAAVNRNTVTPFFLELLMPVNDFSFETVSVVWFWCEVTALLLMIAGFYHYQKDREIHFWILFTGFVVIGCSQCFTFHGIAGQSYIFYALLFGILFYCFNKEGVINNVITAIIFAFLFLLRPVAIVFILPLLIKKKWQIISLFSGLLFLYFSVEYLSGSLWIWKEYSHAMQDWGYEYFKSAVSFSYEELNYSSSIEGSSVIKTSPYWHISEDSSVRGLVYRFLQVKLFAKDLMIITIAGFVFLLLLFRKKIKSMDTSALFILSFLLYFIAELCLPAIRLKFLPFDLTLAELIFAGISLYYINLSKPINA
ncbi:MAG: DUF2029 domain-containing protein [Sphingobacteriales bacterium]|nr:DUF2029 domain-containing protein [Sphingobacteriales bacterium]